MPRTFPAERKKARVENKTLRTYVRDYNATVRALRKAEARGTAIASAVEKLRQQIVDDLAKRHGWFSGLGPVDAALNAMLVEWNRS